MSGRAYDCVRPRIRVGAPLRIERANGMTFDVTAGGFHPSRTELIRIVESLR